jgi:hypothetical protein
MSAKKKNSKIPKHLEKFGRVLLWMIDYQPKFPKPQRRREN